ncbi:MAG: ribosome maturation factor RimM [Candidatus Muiribacteriota bacterium]
MARLLNLEISEKKTNENLIEVGLISGIQGLKGGLRVTVYPEFFLLFDTGFPESVFIDDNEFILTDSYFHGKKTRIFLQNIDNYDKAKEFLDKKIFINKNFFKINDKDVYSLEQLADMTVKKKSGELVGVVKDFYSNPFCSYLLLDNEELIPFIKKHILNIDSSLRTITVDWEWEEDDEF